MGFERPVSRRGVLKGLAVLVGGGTAVTGTVLGPNLAVAAGSDLPPTSPTDTAPGGETCSGPSKPDLLTGTSATTPEIPVSAEALAGVTPESGLSAATAELMAVQQTLDQAIQRFYVKSSPEVLEAYMAATRSVRSVAPTIAEDGTKSYSYGIEGKGTVMLDEKTDTDGKLLEASLQCGERIVNLQFVLAPDGNRIYVPRMSYSPISVETRTLGPEPTVPSRAASVSTSTTALAGMGGYDPSVATSSNPNYQSSAGISSPSVSPAMQAISDVSGTIEFFNMLAE